MLANLPRWIWIVLVGVVLILPSIGNYGLWDPGEIREADVAREVADKGSFADTTVDGQYGHRSVLFVWLVALGFKMFGVNEFAGRLPLALCALMGLLLAYRIGRRLVSREAGVLSAFVLLTTPVFLFQSRQLISDMPFFTCLLAGAGGLAAFIWPVDGKRARFDLVIGGIGLVGGFLARGLLLGAAFPLLCLTIAAAFSWRSRHRAEAPCWPAEGGESIKEGESFGAALRGAMMPLAVTLGVVAVAIGLLLVSLSNPNYMLMGGELRSLKIPPQFHLPFRDLGFGFFPWFAVLPIALLSFMWSYRGPEPIDDPSVEPPVDPEPDIAGSPYRSQPDPAVPAEPLPGRDRFPKLLIVTFAFIGYAVAVVWAGNLGQVRFPALPWLAIGVGLFLYEIFRGDVRFRLWGLVAAAIVLVLQQDFVVAPKSLAFAHMLQPGKYPTELDIKMAMRMFGLAMAVLFFFSLGGAPHPYQPTDFARSTRIPRSMDRRGLRWLGWIAYGLWTAIGWLIDQLSWIGANIGHGLRVIAGRNERHLWIATGGCALVFAAWCTWYLTPQLSLHLSNKALFGTYHRCKSGNERLSQYMVSGRGAAYYNDGQVDKIGTQADLFKQFRDQSKRSFVLIPSSQLAPVDKAARQGKVPYHVLDDRNSHYLILSNKLAGKCNKDLNPLRRLVLRKPPKPQKIKRAIFDNRVQLLGYDLKDTVTRGGKFKLTLYFKVLSRMPANQKIFIHFDQPAHRFHGDHKPLDGKYPTQYWLPGDYIVDPYDVEIPLLTTPSGTYTMWMGIYLGSRRLKVVSGKQDGGDRVRLGTLRVR